MSTKAERNNMNSITLIGQETFHRMVVLQKVDKIATESRQADLTASQYRILYDLEKFLACCLSFRQLQTFEISEHKELQRFLPGIITCFTVVSVYPTPPANLLVW